ncbi:sensor histidine kinase [Myroides guanonis]|uniref:Histidine kinase n=1 Tax=Myroides guanonis TaxID=1150112 RepID=A0A1I3QJQ6_9FLAO|nr:histidine kinase [Myroides guanonis]SFJ34353.1 Histidine kinase [Myroides guanonis]
MSGRQNLLDLTFFLNLVSVEVKMTNQSKVTNLVGIALIGILIFLMIPLSYGMRLPFVYWVNQIVFFLLLLSLLFLNTKWLAPKFLFQKKYFQYYFILCLVCILMVFLLKQSGKWLNLSEEIQKAIKENGNKQNHWAQTISVFFYIFLIQILILGVNIAGILIKKWQSEKNIRLKLEKDKLEMELSFLKSQINPHFFFNTLNTINALTYTNVVESRMAIKKLGNIMRHLLYDISDQTHTFSKEVEFINSYVDLMKMRSPKRVSVDFFIDIKSPDLKIASMIFLPFIENSFKHGVSAQSNSPITIGLKVEDFMVVFYTKNLVFENVIDERFDDNQHGIGIDNTRRRLELLYPNKYSLSITKNDEFNVLLKIDLNED